MKTLLNNTDSMLVGDDKGDTIMVNNQTKNLPGLAKLFRVWVNSHPQFWYLMQGNDCLGFVTKTWVDGVKNPKFVLRSSQYLHSEIEFTNLEDAQNYLEMWLNVEL